VSRPASRRDHIQSLERGLAVITAFSAQHRRMSLSEVAERTGLTRATARRVLLTLVGLGYACTDGRSFELTPKILDLGHAYLSSLDLASYAQAPMEALVERARESSSAAVLDGSEIVYVVRVPTTRIMTIALGLGSRLPAYVTSMGRVLLAELDDEALSRVLGASELDAHTDRTITDPSALREELLQVRRRGWALVDQELEEGLRSIAAPIRNDEDRVIAAINLSTHAGRATRRCLTETLLPMLLDTAEEISAGLRRAPSVGRR
jgi:IclR family transcriptional regulator, pca regulon regulatory protein